MLTGTIITPKRVCTCFNENVVLPAQARVCPCACLRQRRRLLGTAEHAHTARRVNVCERHKSELKIFVRIVTFGCIVFWATQNKMCIQAISLKPLCCTK